MDSDMLRELSLDDMKGILEGIGEKPYRAKQLYEWVYKKGVTS